MLNGSDPTNPNNLHFKATVGERLVVAHAELIDLSKDTNSTKDALVAAIKTKDIKVFVLIGQGAFADGITVYGLDRGIFGPGFQVLVSDGGVITEAMSVRSRLALVRLEGDATVVVENHRVMRRGIHFRVCTNLSPISNNTI